MKKILIYIFAALLGTALLISCNDDFDFAQGVAGDGLVTINGTVEFEPQGTALASRAEGSITKNIHSLTIVIYNADEDTTLLGIYPVADFTVNNEQQDPLPTDYTYTPAEATTARASFSLPNIPMGKYYMYAVANLDRALTAAEVETPQMLREIQLSWDSDDVSNNCQMFGYFTVGNGDSQGFNAPEIALNRLNAGNLHAWLRRVASKVTLVIDGSQLHNGVDVYIHKVTIRDIPLHVRLGVDNKPTSLTELADTGASLYFTADGKMHEVDPNPGSENNVGVTNAYNKWMKVARGSGLKGAVTDGVPHGENERALYFFENVQGDFENHPSKDLFDKRQKWDSLGNIINQPGQPDFKDNIPCGTYIEVEGYYESTHLPNISRGEIKYRFMLGQNTTYDYNAWRNCHYKLTMKLKGYANQADWHIEYAEEAPELYLPSVYYVSYLYNRQAMLPVRATGNLRTLECEIIENNWAPFDSTRTENVPEATIPDDRGTFNWAYDVWANAQSYQNTANYKSTSYMGITTAQSFGPNGTASNTADFYYGRHKVRYDKNTAGDTTMYITPPHAGFLSLTVPSAYESFSTNIPASLFGESGAGMYYDGKLIKALQEYFYCIGSKGITSGTGAAVNDIPQNIRKFDITPGSHGNGRNEYFVTKNEDNTLSFQIPMWTRPQSMIYISGFSGNNPYETFMRKAVLRFRATFEVNGYIKTRYKDVVIYQCRRIINPKGVWRAYDNPRPFTVTLMHRLTPKSLVYQPFSSNGSWKAYIDGATMATSEKFFTLSGGVKQVGDTIFGDDGSNISFTINFNGSIGEHESKCGLIRVLYHGFNSEHTVFVRQGYNDPLDVAHDGTLWSSYSVYAMNGTFRTATKVTVEETKNPLALGTFFKRGNYNYGIITINNEDDKFPRGVNPAGAKFTVRRLKEAANGTSPYTDYSKAWSEIGGIAAGPPSASSVSNTSSNYVPPIGTPLPNTNNLMWNDRTYAFPMMENDRFEYQVPTYEQYNALVTNCDLGFGVLYTGTADAPATDAEEAFGYLDYDNDGHMNAQGMRGCVVYNRQNADQIFFPVGYAGVGRRTIQSANNNLNEAGVLRYGSSSVALSVSAGAWNQFRPISYNNHENNGAIYWFNTYVGGNVAWDINFNDLNFAPYDYGCCHGNLGRGGGGDALPIKLVVTKKK